MSETAWLLEERQRALLLEELDELLTTRQLRNLVAQLRALAQQQKQASS